MIAPLLSIEQHLGTRRMATSKQCVNLDALIQREDLEIVPEEGTRTRNTREEHSTIRLDELVKGSRFYKVLRKPDFQRETSNWTPEAIVELVKNQVDDELIPAIILWNSPNNEVFVIDGAHRLSALIAWVNDDYGDREISRAFFGAEIPRTQENIADETRKFMEKAVRSFKFLSSLADTPSAGTDDERRRGNALALTKIKTQWVTGDATKAEDSFVRINQGGAVIDAIEKEIIAARTKPEGLAPVLVARLNVRLYRGGEFLNLSCRQGAWSSHSLSGKVPDFRGRDRGRNYRFAFHVCGFWLPRSDGKAPLVSKSEGTGPRNGLVQL